MTNIFGIPDFPDYGRITAGIHYRVYNLTTDEYFSPIFKTSESAFIYAEQQSRHGVIVQVEQVEPAADTVTISVVYPTDTVVELDVSHNIVPLAPIYDPEFDRIIGELCKYCDTHNLEVHTKIKGGSFIVTKRKRRIK